MKLNPNPKPKGASDPRLSKKPSGGYLNKEGAERPSSIPLDPPLGYKRTPSLSEQIRAMVRSEALAQATAAAGVETFDEADDFDVGEDIDPSSPWEVNFDQVPISELREALRAAEALEATNAASNPPIGAPDSSTEPLVAPTFSSSSPLPSSPKAIPTPVRGRSQP